MHKLESKEHKYSEKSREGNFPRIYSSHSNVEESQTKKKKKERNLKKDDYKYVQKIKDNKIFLMNFKETQTAEWNEKINTSYKRGIHQRREALKQTEIVEIKNLPSQIKSSMEDLIKRIDQGGHILSVLEKEEEGLE